MNGSQLHAVNPLRCYKVTTLDHNPVFGSKNSLRILKNVTLGEAMSLAMLLDRMIMS